MKVSFDFDGTLSRRDVQQFAKELVAKGHEVWIVTSRFSDEEAKLKHWHWTYGQNEKLFNIADDVGIERSHIHFTCMESKFPYLKGKGFVFHLDDDEIELMDILKDNDGCKPINVDHFEWKETCLDILNKNGKDI